MSADRTRPLPFTFRTRARARLGTQRVAASSGFNGKRSLALIGRLEPLSTSGATHDVKMRACHGLLCSG